MMTRSPSVGKGVGRGVMMMRSPSVGKGVGRGVMKLRAGVGLGVMIESISGIPAFGVGFFEGLVAPHEDEGCAWQMEGATADREGRDILLLSTQLIVERITLKKTRDTGSNLPPWE